MMNLRKLGLLASTSASVVFLVVACSSETGTSDGTDSGTTNDGGGGGGDGAANTDGGGGGTDSGGGTTDKCALPPGKYTSHYTTATGTTTCPKPADSTLTISPSDGGTAADAGSACTSTTDTATCTITTDCTFNNAGYTTKSKTVIKNTNGTVTGSQTSKTTKDADGSVLSDCSYEFTWTKQ